MLLLGEVSGVSARGDSLFFTVKDEGAQIAAVCFQYKKTYLPRDGEKVLLRGTPEYYQKGGRITFIVTKIEPFGQGKLLYEIEQRKKRLAEEGLFDEAHKMPLPRFPINVAVVTSAQGAAVQDIISTVRKYNQIINLTVIDVRVQGDGAEKDIIKGLLKAERQKSDVVILARGGGSFEDLLPFNAEDVARAIYCLSVPVISAIGHETDYTICDFVADARALTPTAAAGLVAFDTAELAKSIIETAERAGGIVSARISSRQTTLERKVRDICYICRSKLDGFSLAVKKLLNSAGRAAEAKFNQRENTLGNILSKLSALNPAALLEKGYFKAAKNGVGVSSIEELDIGDIFVLYGNGGKLDAEVINKQR